MKKPLLLIIISFLILPVIAHEFWLQPEKFIYKKGEPINIRFWVGEDFAGINWTGNRAKVISLQLYSGNSISDLAGNISDANGDSLQLSIPDEGTAMVTFNSANSFIQLDAAKFNAYLKDDGLQNAMDYRAVHNETDTAGKEFYQRSVKTLIQVGSKKSNISHPTNLPLDIVPLKNPYGLKDNDSLTVRILFNKQILTNQLVNVWQRRANKTNRQVYHTNEKGELVFKVPAKGKWMVSTVKMIRADNNQQANWQSYWGSCTWGYE
jgi:uncharacterized GH25 family protein